MGCWLLLLSLPLWPWLLPNLNPNHTVVMDMVDMVVDTVMVDMVADMEDTVVVTMVVKREKPKLMPELKPMLTQMPKLMPMPHPIIMVDTTAEDTDMVDMDTDTTEAKDLPMLKPNPTTDMVDTTAEDTDTEDIEVMVDTVMADMVVEKFSQDQVTRI